MKRFFALSALLVLFATADVMAQWGVGASFERRSDRPTNGFGFQLEYDVLDRIPMVSVRTRLHASYFSEEASISLGGLTATTGKVEAFDFGGAVLGGVKFGLFMPYAGVGVGAENWRFDDDGDGLDNFLYGVAGVAITPIPFLKPYIEYRVSSYNDVSAAKKEIGEGRGRFHLGITLQF